MAQKEAGFEVTQAKKAQKSKSEKKDKPKIPDSEHPEQIDKHEFLSRENFSPDDFE